MSCSSMRLGVTPMATCFTIEDAGIGRCLGRPRSGMSQVVMTIHKDKSKTCIPQCQRTTERKAWYFAKGEVLETAQFIPYWGFLNPLRGFFLQNVTSGFAGRLDEPGRHVIVSHASEVVGAMLSASV